MTVTRRKATVTGGKWTGVTAYPVALHIPPEETATHVYVDGAPVPFEIEDDGRVWTVIDLSGDDPVEVDIYTTNG